MKKVLRLQHLQQPTRVYWIERLPDEEGIETYHNRFQRHHREIERLPDEEGIETVKFFLPLEWTGLNGYLMKKVLRHLLSVHPIINAVSLACCLVLVEKSLLFYPVSSWKFSIGPYGFSRLDKYGAYFFNQ